MDTIIPELVSEVESARTIGRTSGRSARVEVLTRAERRRSWTLEQKTRDRHRERWAGADPDGGGAQARHQHRTDLYVAASAAERPGAMLLQAPLFTSVELTPSSHPAPSPAPAPAVGPEVERGEQARHHAPVVGALGGAHRGVHARAC